MYLESDKYTSPVPTLRVGKVIVTIVTRGSQPIYIDSGLT